MKELAVLLALWYLFGGKGKRTMSKIELKRWPVIVWGPNPVRTSRVTQEYKRGIHLGVDIAVPGALQTAKADVVAVADGKVLAVQETARGWSVLLDHGGWSSAYLHLQAVEADVSAGNEVMAGQVLGPMGADPMDPEDVVHLHFQLAVDGSTVDPAPYLAVLSPT